MPTKIALLRKPMQNVLKTWKKKGYVMQQEASVHIFKTQRAGPSNH